MPAINSPISVSTACCHTAFLGNYPQNGYYKVICCAKQWGQGQTGSAWVKGWSKGLRQQRCWMKINKFHCWHMRVSSSPVTVSAHTKYAFRQLACTYVSLCVLSALIKLQCMSTVSLWCTSTHAWNQVVSVFMCAFLFVKVHLCVLSEPAPYCPHLLKSFSVSSSSSPWPRRRRWRSSMSRAMIFSNSWFKAWCRVVARSKHDQTWKILTLICVCNLSTNSTCSYKLVLTDFILNLDTVQLMRHI